MIMITSNTPSQPLTCFIFNILCSQLCAGGWAKNYNNKTSNNDYECYLKIIIFKYCLLVQHSWN